MSIYAIKKQNDGKLVVGGAFAGNYQSDYVQFLTRLNTDGTFDTTFNTGDNPSDPVRSIAIQNDGKIIVGGGFTNYSGSIVNRIVRLNTSGSIDTSFNTGDAFNGTVYSVAIQNDGKILAGGSYSAYSASLAANICRINTNGTLDNTFNYGEGTNGGVSSLAVQNNGKIIIVGNFSNYSGSSAPTIARINTDGTLDTTFNMGSGFNGAVYTVAAQNDGKVLVGGNFGIYSGSGVSQNIVRLNVDGTIDSTFDGGTGFNNTVWTIAIQNEEILVGGDFSYYKNIVYSNQFIKLTNSGSVYESFKNRVQGAVIPA